MVEGFFEALTEDPAYTTTTVRRWDAVREFMRSIARRLAVHSDEWQAVSALLDATPRIRSPKRGRFKFPRALPPDTLRALQEICNPDSDRNPFDSEPVRWRNWLIVHLLLLVGLRRGEALLLSVDSMKHGIDEESGELIYWLDVTSTEYEDTRATRPSIKTADSHRQVPISDDLAALYQRYVESYRAPSDSHGFLLTSNTGRPLSAEAVTKLLRVLTQALPEHASKAFRARTKGKLSISSHDLRHTCATARYSMFLALDSDRELALQRMRAFFGWSLESTMPDVYARAAIEGDLVHAWKAAYNRHIEELRCLAH